MFLLPGTVYLNYCVWLTTLNIRIDCCLILTEESHRCVLKAKHINPLFADAAIAAVAETADAAIAAFGKSFQKMGEDFALLFWFFTNRN